MNAMMINTKAGFGQLEWKVVDMARKDGPRSLNPEGFMARLSRDFLGFPVPRRLANRSLEAVRRFCVRAWYWDLIPTKDMHAFADAGYSWADARQILAHVAMHRGFTPSIEQNPA